MHLLEVGAENWHRCASVRVRESQTKLICTSLKALVEAAHVPDLYAFELRQGDDTVGILIIGKWPTSYEIHRFMIDERHQGRGHATAALRELLRHWADARPEVIVKFLHWNEWAEKIYRRVGFYDTGHRDGHEKVFKLDWMQHEQYMRARHE